MELAHIVKTTHHDTGRIDLFCGESRDHRSDPLAGAPPCADCVLAALNAARHESHADVVGLAEAVNEELRTAARRNLDRHDTVTLRLERIEDTLRKMKKKKR